MNFKKIFLLNLVVFFSVVSYSQNTIFLNWISTDENGIKVETFENSTYLQDYQGLPSYQRITKLKSSEYYEIELFDIEYKEDIILENLELIKKIKLLSQTGFINDENIVALCLGLYQFTRPFNFDQSYYMQETKKGRHKTLNLYLKNFIKNFSYKTK